MHRRLLATVLILMLPGLICTATDDNYGWIPSRIPADQLDEVYGTESDEIDIDDARDLLYRLTNNARIAINAQVLLHSDPAAEVCQGQADEMAENRYLNHYSLAGNKCERRFNLLGHADQITENIAYLEVEHGVFLTPQLIRRIFSFWMDSDPHRLNLLNRHHTGLGFGISIIRADGITFVAAAACFVRNYGSYKPLPLSASLGSGLLVSGRITDPEAKLAYLAVAVEAAPRKRTPEYQRTHMQPYSQPQPYLQILAAENSGLYHLDSNPRTEHCPGLSPDSDRFTAMVEIPAENKPGLYYVTAWAVKGDSEPFCIMTQTVLVGPANEDSPVDGAEQRVSVY